MRACVTVALVVVLCAACADAFSPHRAMKARGPVSPFPIEPLASAPARQAQPPRPPSPVAPANPQLTQAVTNYLQRWSWAGGATPFAAAPAMELYGKTPAVTPQIHTLLQAAAPQLARTNFDLTGAAYADAIAKAYGQFERVRVKEVAGARTKLHHSALAQGPAAGATAGTDEVNVTFNAALTLHSRTATFRCRAKLFFTAPTGPAAKYVIAKEELRCASAPLKSATTAAGPAAAAKSAKKP